LEVAAAVGVPPSTPVEGFRLRPAGNVPADTDQLYGVVPRSPQTTGCTSSPPSRQATGLRC
jgi:hypothetical protein